RGEFTFANLASGRYTITATLAGFRTVMQQIDVSAGATARPTLTMGVGALTESVTVTGQLPKVDTQSSSVSSSYMAVAAAPPYEMARRATADGFNTEAYDRIKDNEWIEVARRPLSTFSAYVDHASYPH